MRLVSFLQFCAETKLATHQWDSPLSFFSLSLTLSHTLFHTHFIVGASPSRSVSVGVSISVSVGVGISVSVGVSVSISVSVGGRRIPRGDCASASARPGACDAETPMERAHGPKVRKLVFM